MINMNCADKFVNAVYAHCQMQCFSILMTELPTPPSVMCGTAGYICKYITSISISMNTYDNSALVADINVPLSSFILWRTSWIIIFLTQYSLSIRMGEGIRQRRDGSWCEVNYKRHSENGGRTNSIETNTEMVYEFGRKFVWLFTLIKIRSKCSTERMYWCIWYEPYSTWRMCVNTRE
jgi:hypothetical protein